MIDRELCLGCSEAEEPPCARTCPGDLLQSEEGGRIALREVDGCWDCASCVKVCPRGALSLTLPVELGGRGSKLTARTAGGRTRWTLRRWDGRIEKFET
ncbi:MAG: 4Fe-4S dicluster domain-containing protein [Betaproteobacteria bacterium]